MQVKEAQMPEPTKKNPFLSIPTQLTLQKKRGRMITDLASIGKTSKKTKAETVKDIHAHPSLQNNSAEHI